VANRRNTPEGAEPGQAAENLTDRERLILHHLPQVRLIARSFHERLPSSVSFDDLISAGVIGLIAALDDFHPKPGVTLQEYAEYRIRGAMLDSLRRLNWESNEVRNRSRLIESAISSLEQKNLRTPTASEIAAELGISPAVYASWLLRMGHLAPTSVALDAPQNRASEKLDLLYEPEEHNPEAIVRNLELRQLLESATNRLSPVEKRIITLYYGADFSVRQLSVLLKLHESRVSHLKNKALKKLRLYLEETQFSGSDERYARALTERADLVIKKYAAGLTRGEGDRLLEIEKEFESEELMKADLIDDQVHDERIARIDAGLDRVEKAIRDLEGLNRQ